MTNDSYQASKGRTKKRGSPNSNSNGGAASGGRKKSLTPPNYKSAAPIFSKSYASRRRKYLRGSPEGRSSNDSNASNEARRTPGTTPSKRDPCRTILRDINSDLIGCGYEISTGKLILTWIGIFLSFGLLRLIFHWKRHWLLKCTHNVCPLTRCTKILLQDIYGQFYVENIQIAILDRVQQQSGQSPSLSTASPSNDSMASRSPRYPNYGIEVAGPRNVEDERTQMLTPASESSPGLSPDADASSPESLERGSPVSRIVRSIPIPDAAANYQLIPPTLSRILQQHQARFFINKKIKYVWLPEIQDFEKLKGIEEHIPCSNFRKMHLLNSDEKFRRKALYGPNEIYIEITSRLTLLFLEVLNPFYIFQVYSCILWIFQDYYYFVSYIIIVSIILITVTIRQTRKMQRDLRNLVMMTGNVQLVNHSGNILSVKYESLVPGDIILIPENESIMLCDAILLSGNVIVNESMLTGESVAFTKTPISSEDTMFNLKSEARSILFNGTKILQTRSLHGEPVKALVLRTGFMTLKGELIQSILYPKPIDFKFSKHTYKFIGVLALIAMLGFFYTLGLMIISHKADPSTIAIRALDLITITVSPALPISMAVGIIFAQRRLKKLGVFCISPKTINIVAALNLICFDKTGTITMEDLDLLGVVPIDRDNHFESCQDIIGLAFSPLLKCLVTCHSLTKLDGKFIGDPLDIKMFNATHWIMRDSYEIMEPSFGDYDVVAEFTKPPASKTLDKMPKIGIIRQFPFTSAAQSMSVIVSQQNSDRIEFYIKGSPEKLAQMCIPDSMPKNYMEELFHYTQQGYRVIALAWKPLGLLIPPQQIQDLKRSELENGLIFLGFMILENRPKPDSRQIIQLLQDADLRTVMITGDNIYTAICVAKDVDMIQHNEKVILIEAVEPKQLAIANVNKMLCVNPLTPPGSQLGSAPTPPTSKNGVRDISGTPDTMPLSFKGGAGGGGGKGRPPTAGLKKSNNLVNRPIIMYRYAESGHFYSQSVEKRRSSVYMPRSHEELESLQLSSKKGITRQIKYHFALNGKTLKAIQNWHPYLLPKILSRGTVFARMSPEQKGQLIESFQSLGYYVGMCGDGANDCGALKMAHAGISLSENESSIASPFTSKTQSISCVPLILREGRAALTTSFGIFKYLASYSMVQFVSVTILYWVKASLTDFEYLYVDLFEMMFLAITFGRTLAYPYLSKERPPLSLLSFLPIFSIISCLIINICAQLTAFLLVRKQPWFEPLIPSHSKDYYSYQNACVFSISNFQYIVLALIFSKGPPFRMPLYTNYAFVAAVVILSLVSGYILLFGHPKLLEFMQYRQIPDMKFRFVILGIAIVNSILLIINERLLVQKLLKNTVQKKLNRKHAEKYPYQRLEKEMEALDPDSIVNIGLEPSDQCIDLGLEEKEYGYTFETEETEMAGPGGTTAPNIAKLRKSFAGNQGGSIFGGKDQDTNSSLDGVRKFGRASGKRLEVPNYSDDMAVNSGGGSKGRNNPDVVTGMVHSISVDESNLTHLNQNNNNSNFTSGNYGNHRNEVSQQIIKLKPLMKGSSASSNPQKLGAIRNAKMAVKPLSRQKIELITKTNHLSSSSCSNNRSNINPYARVVTEPVKRNIVPGLNML